LILSNADRSLHAGHIACVVSQENHDPATVAGSKAKEKTLMPRGRKTTGTARRAGSRRSSGRTQRPGRRTQRVRARASSRTAVSKVKYSKWIESPEEHEEKEGQSLATRNHEVIRQWAETRRAVPAAAGDGKRGNGVGVLRMDFPGYGGSRLKKVSWNRWFETFDNNELVFLFQEHKADGSTSNFFKLNRLK
jgi:hypothetical protein